MISHEMGACAFLTLVKADKFYFDVHKKKNCAVAHTNACEGL